MKDSAKRYVYADNAATTAVSPQVVEAMLPYLTEHFGNPSSLYMLGQTAHNAVETARGQVAALLGAHPEEIYFTSGGSEADNWAIRGLAEMQAKKGKRHIVTTKFEHHAVLHTVERLQREGFEATFLDVHENGIVRIEEVAAALREDTALVTIMYANNEIGTIQPIAEIGALCRARGIPFHTDAVQAAGHVPVDVKEGQKTGFFLDQRENRELVKRYAKGRTVLNTFCYTGGFSVYAMAGGARKVCSVDSSERAVTLATENMVLNFGREADFCEIAADAVEYLKDIGDKYDLIILDPPAFAKHHKVLGNALQGYKRLNARAISQIKPGGILITFSCSQAVSKELFRTTVFSAAAIAGRNVRILHQMTQPADHPISIYHPEGEYLKGLVLYVE